ncbi:flagellar basal body-associated FliL family protein [Pseudomonas knackmussii]|uniref:flagellar basal body-associated FliL family protein n=1 Tax=Pseudomonas knackmussii TaxID=65741 RepID=UPI00136387CE|nr:flagellar basal body-associated FliL family protein [Pseudomonas knackmussii]
MTMPRIMLLVTVLNLLVAGGGVAATWFLARPLLAERAQAEAAKAGADKGKEEEKEQEPAEFEFFPVTKIIVSLPGSDGREHYFVLDLVLQAEQGTAQKKLEQIDPMVRNSAVAHLSALTFEQLRGKSVPALQAELEQVLLADFATRKVIAPFQHVLVSKLIVQ